MAGSDAWQMLRFGFPEILTCLKNISFHCFLDYDVGSGLMTMFLWTVGSFLVFCKKCDLTLFLSVIFNFVKKLSNPTSLISAATLKLAQDCEAKLRSTIFLHHLAISAMSSNPEVPGIHFGSEGDRELQQTASLGSLGNRSMRRAGDPKQGL